jgi:hypothetical protein
MDTSNSARRQQQRESSLIRLLPLYDNPVLADGRAPSDMATSRRFVVNIVHLSVDAVGDTEPVFASMALYDVSSRQRMSENFYFDTNTERVRHMLRAHTPCVDASTLCKQAVFECTHVTADMVLLIRVHFEFVSYHSCAGRQSAATIRAE